MARLASTSRRRRCTISPRWYSIGPAPPSPSVSWRRRLEAATAGSDRQLVATQRVEVARDHLVRGVGDVPEVVPGLDEAPPQAPVAPGGEEDAQVAGQRRRHVAALGEALPDPRQPALAFRAV